MKKLRNFRKKQDGSITIEASLSLFLFIALFIGIISLIHISRAQAIIGTTIHKSALEMSQYAYYYKASGLYDLEGDIQGRGQDAQNNMNSFVKEVDTALLGVETIYNLVDGAKDQVEGKKDLHPDDIPNIIKQMQDIYVTGEQEAGNIKGAMDGMSDRIDGVINNPLDFAKALLALGISSAGDQMKSRLIAAPLAKAMCINHLEKKSGEKSVDGYLKALNIVDGEKGLNFNMSTLFHSESHSDINIIVVYKVKVLTLLGKDFELTFAQSASTRGWVGDSGSRNPMAGVGGESNPSGGNNGGNGGGGNTSDPTSGDEGNLGTIPGGGNTDPISESSAVDPGLGIISGGGSTNPTSESDNGTIEPSSEVVETTEEAEDPNEITYTGGRTQEELDDLARDPSHGFRIEEQGIKERKIGLDLEERGILGHIVRDPQETGGSEYIDTETGIKWDIKSFESYPNGHTDPKKGAFKLENAMKKINKEFNKGYNVIIDTRNLESEHIEELKDELEAKGLSDRIIWYP